MTDVSPILCSLSITDAHSFKGLTNISGQCEHVREPGAHGETCVNHLLWAGRQTQMKKIHHRRFLLKLLCLFQTLAKRLIQPVLIPPPRRLGSTFCAFACYKFYGFGPKFGEVAHFGGHFLTI